MNPEEKLGPVLFYQQLNDWESVKLEALVSEIHVDLESNTVSNVDWGSPGGSITGTFTSNVRKMSPSLAIYFKRVSALGYVYIDDIRNLF